MEKDTLSMECRKWKVGGWVIDYNRYAYDDFCEYN